MRKRPPDARKAGLADRPAKVIGGQQRVYNVEMLQHKVLRGRRRSPRRRMLLLLLLLLLHAVLGEHVLQEGRVQQLRAGIQAMQVDCTTGAAGSGC
mgnify:CR=1 FL=1